MYSYLYKMKKDVSLDTCTEGKKVETICGVQQIIIIICVTYAQKDV